MKDKNKKLLIVVGVLLLFGGLSLAYFVTKILTNGNGGNTSVTTAVINGATVNVEGILSFEDLDILPGHKSVSGIKVTATGNNELIPYNLIWKGTNTLTTPLNFTIYKTSEEINVTATCEKKTKTIGSAKALSEECTISNIDKLGSEIATGTINKNDTKIILAKDEFITATSTGDIKYYYVILEYPNLDEPQNEDLSGEFEGEVTVEESNIKPDINILAAYVVQEDGTYKEVEEIPQEGYQLNNEKSTCSNGTIPSWDVKNKRFYADNLTTSGTSCYLYFDKYVPTASETILANITIKTDIPNFGQAVITDEGVYAVSDGMYGGTSYYWRGAATTNHVIFANKCWRIVRINGDGSIRLIFNGTVKSGNTCTGNGSNSEAVIMGSTDSEKYYSTSDGQSDMSYYVGWTYGTGQRTLGGTESNAKVQTEKWFNNNITGVHATKVANGKFCNDRNVDYPPTSWDWDLSDDRHTTMWVANNKEFAYASSKRLLEVYEPSLNCNQGDTYSLKVGAITADEAVMIGGKSGAGNGTYYLYSGLKYWTLTPSYYYYDNYHSYSYMFIIWDDGQITFTPTHTSTIGIRPVINLRSDITFSGGDGTLNNPYVVAD